MSHTLSHISRVGRWSPSLRLSATSATVALAFLATACGGDTASPPDFSANSGQPAAADTNSGNGSMADNMNDMATPDRDEMTNDMAGMNMDMMMETVATESWDGMRVELAAMPPTTFTLFQGPDATVVEPGESDSVHLMAVLADDQSGERIPYADVWVTLRDNDGAIVFDERMWPMLSRAMGTHYGINVPLPEAGTYAVDLQVGAPQGARHPEYAERWLEPTSFEMTFTWNG